RILDLRTCDHDELIRRALLARPQELDHLRREPRQLRPELRRLGLEGQAFQVGDRHPGRLEARIERLTGEEAQGRAVQETGGTVIEMTPNQLRDDSTVS